MERSGVFLLEAQGLQKSFNQVPALHNGCLTLLAGSVHALCGGNGAGKSTFLNIIMGLLKRDGGTLRLKGREVNFSSPAAALAQRIAIITQELSPIPGMTVAENLFLGREPRYAGALVNYRQLRLQSQALLDKLGFDIDADRPLSQLSLAQIQLVEIAKAFSRDSDILIMDEPTSSIGERETETLFKAIRSVTRQGAGIIYVSHRLSEIFTIADRYTVFRDGGFIESGLLANIDRPHLVRQIVGHELTHQRQVRQPRQQQPVLATRALTRSGEFSQISLQVRPGEILGIYGLVGSGRSEYLNALYGLTQPDSGEVQLQGKPLTHITPSAAIGAGLALVTEDRKKTGLVLSASIQDNIGYSALPSMTRFGVVNFSQLRALVQRMIGRIAIKTASARLPVSSMSGGNQQKVVLARCLSTRPICLLCDEPTRGIDEGAKEEVYSLLDEFVRDGGAVIVVSSEAPEILKLSDRIAIFKAGALVHQIDAATASQEELLHLAS